MVKLRRLPKRMRGRQFALNDMNMKEKIYPDFFPVLEENYQAQIAGFYNYDKTDEERRKRLAVIQEYEDLISIYKYKTKLINEQEVQASVATEDDSSPTAG